MPLRGGAPEVFSSCHNPRVPSHFSHIPWETGRATAKEKLICI